MKKNLVKFISCLVLGTAILSTPALISSEANAHPVHYYCASEVHVCDGNGFRYAMEEACNGTTIILDADIYLDDPVDINASVTIRKNGHKIMEYYKIDHHGYFSLEPVTTYVTDPGYDVYDAYGNYLYHEVGTTTEHVSYEDVWHEGWIESGYREIF